MKKVPYYLFFAALIPLLFLFKPRQDIVFGAINECQCIRLFENDNEFELRIEDNNLFTGNYSISRDTVFLSYKEHLEVNGMQLSTKQAEDPVNLPAKLHLSENTIQFVSLHDTLFSAEIFLDKRQLINAPEPINIRVLSTQADFITSLGTNGPAMLLRR